MTYGPLLRVLQRLPQMLIPARPRRDPIRRVARPDAAHPRAADHGATARRPTAGNGPDPGPRRRAAARARTPLLSHNDIGESNVAQTYTF